MSFIICIELECDNVSAALPYLQQPHLLRPKIFVIGLSKTGTTSIGDALALLGYKRLGWKDIRSRHLVHTWAHDDHTALIDQTRYFDAFEDLPWPFVYREMAERYPDAKFVLSLRKDEQTWLRSMRRHFARGRWTPYAHFYGTDRLDGNEEVVLQSYRNHTESVRRYFADKPHRYVELIIDDAEASWAALCTVAECPQGRVPLAAFPQSNTAAHWSNGAIVDSLQYLWGWGLTRVEEMCSFTVYRSGWFVAKSALVRCWDVISVIEQACSKQYYTSCSARAQPLPFVSI